MSDIDQMIDETPTQLLHATEKDNRMPPAPPRQAFATGQAGSLGAIPLGFGEPSLQYRHMWAGGLLVLIIAVQIWCGMHAALVVRTGLVGALLLAWLGCFELVRARRVEWRERVVNTIEQYRHITVVGAEFDDPLHMGIVVFDPVSGRTAYQRVYIRDKFAYLGDERV